MADASSSEGIGAGPPYELGVLVVHGIGNQRQGQTLVQWGDAIADWLARWSGDQVAVGLEEVRLHPDDEPAHGTLTLQGATQAQPTRWLVAEAWWASDFATPSYGQVASWSLRAVPATLFSHVLGIVRRNVGRLRSASMLGIVHQSLVLLLWALVGLPLVLLLAPALVALLLVLLVIGLIPIPRVRSAVLAIQRSLTGTIGDSLVLAASRVQRAAMTERVVGGVRFLKSRECRKVAVVAHSQGAAVAHLASQGLGPDEHIDTLITVGSGIKKLFEILELRSEGWARMWLPSALLAAVVILGLFVAEAVRSGEVELGTLIIAALAVFFGGTALMSAMAWGISKLGGKARTIGIALLVGAIAGSLPLAGWLIGSDDALFAAYFLLFIVVVGVAAAIRKALEPDPPVDDLPSDRVARWVDVYAYNDPVPNGATTTMVAGRPDLAVPVHNLDSVARDHNTYHLNREAGIGPIVCELVQLCPQPLSIGKTDAGRIAIAARHRRWRVQWLTWTRGIVVGAAAAFLLRVDQADAAETAYQWAQPKLPFGLDGLFPQSLSGAWYQALGVAGVAVVATLVLFLASAVWRAWDEADTAALFTRRRPVGTSSPFPRVFLTMWALIIGGIWTDEIVAGLLTSEDPIMSRVFSAAFVLFAIYLYAGVVIWALSRARVYERVTGLHERRLSFWGALLFQGNG